MPIGASSRNIWSIAPKYGKAPGTPIRVSVAPIVVLLGVEEGAGLKDEEVFTIGPVPAEHARLELGGRADRRRLAHLRRVLIAPAGASW